MTKKILKFEEHEIDLVDISDLTAEFLVGKDINVRQYLTLLVADLYGQSYSRRNNKPYQSFIHLFFKNHPYESNKSKLRSIIADARKSLNRSTYEDIKERTRGL